jgi:hypothetical protein
MAGQPSRLPPDHVVTLGSYGLSDSPLTAREWEWLPSFAQGAHHQQIHDTVQSMTARPREGAPV